VWTRRIASRPARSGGGNEQLAIEAPRAEQRLVEILQAVRGSHDDDLLRTVETVELDEELVEGLILLAVEAVAGPSARRPRRARR
jgi:hypothetical protein